MSHIIYPLMVLVGVLAGWCGLMPDFVAEYSIPQYLLYILIIQVGLGLGMRPDLKSIIKSFNPRLFMLPLFTIIGTLAFTYIATLIFREDSSSDLMAIGSGFGYYTLSSVLIGQFKEASRSRRCRVYRSYSLDGECGKRTLCTGIMPFPLGTRAWRGGNLSSRYQLDGRMPADDCRLGEVIECEACLGRTLPWHNT